MLFLDLLFAFVIALLLAAVLAGLSYRRGGTREGTVWPGFLFFFSILLLAVWAGGVWIAPFGPTAWGGHWLPFVVVGIIVALLIAALVPQDRRPPPAGSLPDPGAESPAAAAGLAIGVFFWTLLLGLIAALVFRYI